MPGPAEFWPRAIRATSPLEKPVKVGEASVDQRGGLGDGALGLRRLAEVHLAHGFEGAVAGIDVFQLAVPRLPVLAIAQPNRLQRFAVFISANMDQRQRPRMMGRPPASGAGGHGACRDSIDLIHIPHGAFKEATHLSRSLQITASTARPEPLPHGFAVLLVSGQLFRHHEENGSALPVL